MPRFQGRPACRHVAGPAPGRSPLFGPAPRFPAHDSRSYGLYSEHPILPTVSSEPGKTFNQQPTLQALDENPAACPGFPGARSGKWTYVSAENRLIVPPARHPHTTYSSYIRSIRRDVFRPARSPFSCTMQVSPFITRLTLLQCQLELSESIVKFSKTGNLQSSSHAT
ncbi:hypothetical protein N658DRAFT_496251 [Parathielavia hyrcaniae]|uniref:Uncharacterized protein n=1 Tax=Parathielavia hyrcaniae TaxID=113614 RepID=A0AAN6Q0K6_9PEZI|nr:hypothetical protein N658DRAFT_496251 [Parathielavia hyrcaniae]